MRYRFFWGKVCGFVFSLILCACSTAPQNSIAPQGELKMGLYKGTPTSILPAKLVSGDPRGIGYELGRDLSTKLDVKYSPVVFEKNADVLAAVKKGEVDLVFTNASADRAQYIQFSKTVIQIEKGYLLGPRSKINSPSELNQQKVNIGYSMGSNSARELPGLIPNATLVQTTSTKQAIELLKSGELDGFSSNKAILYEMAGSTPGSRVLPVVIGYESLALGTPLNRNGTTEQLNLFVDEITVLGKLKMIIERSGIQGLAAK